MTDAPVLLERDGALAIITLNRPAAGNTVNPALANELERVVEIAAGDFGVRCVMLTGAGKLFCGGGDIAAMAAAGDGASSFLFDLANCLHRSMERLATMAKPLVVLVNGPAAGAGLSIAIAGDVVIAGRSSHFTAAYGSVGLTPDGGMSWLLPRLVGLRRAQDIILTNRRISAEEAEAIGLVTQTVDDGDLRAVGLAVARGLADGPVETLAGARALLLEASANDLPTHLRAEAERIARAGAGAEAREGVAAFLERRRPDFTGKEPE